MASHRNKPRTKPNAKGRNTGSNRFIMLDHKVLESAAFSSLTPAERSLLIELTMIYNGSNNGSLYLSARDAAARLGASDVNVALAAFDGLIRAGFVELAVDAHFSTKASERSRARCWRLTFHSWPESPNKRRRGPTNDWREYQPASGPQAKRADRRLRALATFRKAKADGRLPVLDSKTLEENMPPIVPGPVLESHTAVPEIGSNPWVRRVLDSHTHIDVTRGWCSPWWKSDAERSLIALQAAWMALPEGLEVGGQRRRKA